MEMIEYQYNKSLTMPKLAWGVCITPIWDDDDEPTRVVDIECSIVKIAPSEVHLMGNEPCLKIADNSYMPISNFHKYEPCHNGDTHDLRQYMFDTRKEAQEHLDYTLNKWQHPQVWESFIQL